MDASLPELEARRAELYARLAVSNKNSAMIWAGIRASI